ncbi:hypothetical protein DPEC_G00183500 [Dallia pectoralis]|uniref:Uncharacterized protein n=1 Tax=Dallia pectoralis TaxID=75939 RepID=A0ACC2GAY9_DALPE|nr:hypothetical protein DPEC_G00183500 [Dallia pectoralis]
MKNTGIRSDPARGASIGGVATVDLYSRPIDSSDLPEHHNICTSAISVADREVQFNFPTRRRLRVGGEICGGAGRATAQCWSPVGVTPRGPEPTGIEKGKAYAGAGSPIRGAECAAYRKRRLD